MASKKIEANGQSEDLICGLCCKGYQDPRHLGCLHSFCLDCLKQHVSNNNWKKTLLCPLCQKEMNIPKLGLQAIEKDYYIHARQEVENLKMTSLCDSCTESSYAKCRCLECLINLCKTCQASHVNFESEKVHRFLEFVEPASEMKPKFALPAKMTYTSFCRVHATEEMDIYCTKCDIVVCKICKEAKHRTHAVQDAKDVAKIMKDSISPLLGSIKEYLPEFQDYVKKLKISQRELETDLENAIKDIKSRSKFLQHEIEKISMRLIAEVKERHKAENDAVDTEVKRVIKSYQSMATLASSAERILKIGSDINVIESSKRIQKRFLQVEDELPSVTCKKIETVGFVPGGLMAQTLQSMFGQCSKGEIELPTLPVPWGLRAAKEIEMRSLSSFKIKEIPDTVQAIAPINDNEAWICCGWGTKEVHLYTAQGEKKKTLELDMQVDHICAIPTGAILVSSYEDKYIKKIDKNFNISDFAIPHLYPGGMVMNKRKELFVCAVDSYTTRRAAHSQRMIMKMSEYGMNLDQIDEDDDTVLFGAPYRVAESTTRELCVTDREEGKLRVTVIDQQGAMKYTYYGPKEVKMKQPFNPLGLCSDRYGNLMISDWGNHCVHLLNSEGEFHGFMLSKKDGLYKPNALALDKVGHLWVGDGNSTIRVYKYSKRNCD